MVEQIELICGTRHAQKLPSNSRIPIKIGSARPNKNGPGSATNTVNPGPDH